MTVYLVVHEWESRDGCEHLKIIGVYSSSELAHSAVDGLRSQSGFRDHPDGFFVSECLLDRTEWREGFGLG